LLKSNTSSLKKQDYFEMNKDFDIILFLGAFGKISFHEKDLVLLRDISKL
jgi:hypothetical protein